MTRVLVLSKYGTLAASPRYRFALFEPFLRREGFELTWSPLLDNEYLEARLTTERVAWSPVARGVLRRLEALARVGRYDLVWLQYELLPFMPALLEHVVRSVGVPYVYDFDDAIFHGYDAHRSSAVRWLLGDKIGHVIAGAAAVTAGSPYLETYARRFSDRVLAVPTVVDTKLYAVKEAVASPTLTIGWIGSPSTSRYLRAVGPALSRLARELPVTLVAIGSLPLEFEGVRVEVVPWSEATEIEQLRRCDVGIMPMVDEPWARGKCAFKLIQYMATGLPVVASPIGMNVDVVDPEVGFLAANDDAWVRALRALHASPSLRDAMGRKGRARVEERYSVSAVAPRVLTALQSAARARPAR